jgi:hypothetical protein
MTEQSQKFNVSWDKEELANWIAANLIPRELLETSRMRDLAIFIATNIETLYKHFKSPPKEDVFKISLPPPEDWDKTYELQVIDRRTGSVVSVLEKGANFEICDGITLQIRAKELEDWKKETAGIKKLTKEQSEELKAFIAKFGSKRPLTRKEIVTFIQEIRKPKKAPKYRQSGHLVDEKLKYLPPNSQVQLFDLISPETRQKIEASETEVKAEGIKLTPPENKLVHALNRLLHDKSPNSRNAKEAGFYEGNAPSTPVSYGTDLSGTELQSKPAVIKFKPSELYKAYVGHDEYSGHDIQFINNTLHQMESKKVLIKYDRIKKVTKNKKTETLTDRIELFQPLIKIISFIPDLTNEEKERLDKGDASIRDARGEIIISLNPIFTDQIDTKFIEFPVDTNRRLVIAAGGHSRVTSSMMTLMEWMLREISAKRYRAEINEEKLPFVLGLDAYVKQGRKKVLQARITKDIEAITNMGIILQSEKAPNSTGGFKWVFLLNKDYE